MVAGGGEIYAQMIGMPTGYTSPRSISPAGRRAVSPDRPAHWREVKREKGVRGPRDAADFVFVDYERAVAKSFKY